MNTIIKCVLQTWHTPKPNAPGAWRVAHLNFRHALDAMHADPIQRAQLARDLASILPAVAVHHARVTHLDLAELPPGNHLRLCAYAPGVSEPWHGHGPRTCSETVLQGELVELLRSDFDPLTPIWQTPWRAGDGKVLHINDLIGTHAVLNCSTCAAYTLRLCTSSPKCTRNS